MIADDPRHGSVAGYRAGCHDDCCRHANTRYDILRRMDVLNGRPRTHDATGTQRRIQALRRLGWSLEHIAEESGIGTFQAIDRLMCRRTVTTSTRDRIADAFERLCMTPGPSGRAARHAERNGWLPPLAWTDIDDPDEIPDMTAVDTLPDPVVIERILAGDWRLSATPAERAEVIGRWAGSLNELERLTGWNVRRDRREESAA